MGYTILILFLNESVALPITIGMV